MRRFRRRSRHHRFRRFVLLVVGLFFIVFLFRSHIFSASRAQAEKPVADTQQSQIFNDDLIVKKGQVYEENVSVYHGDVTVQNGGVIQGNLYVYSGDVDVEEGGRVKGDIAAFSGGVKIAGQIGGR